jgi:pimeloyl-ACP methyl ester carboxylesterase
LFIHGTFSKSEAFFNGMHKAPGGPKAVAELFGRYEQVLAFDHPTLSVSPVMNAFDLVRLLARSDGPLDVVAHSRGGLIARWALDGFGLNGSGDRRAVLVGSPLNGTSLASPPQLRSALSTLTNYGNALRNAGELASVYAPFLAVPLLLLRVVSTVLTVTAKTPITDAAIAMIPGLHGQSRIGDHPELKRLRAVRLARPTRYFIVRSNFETEDAGWQFWKWFRKDKLLDAGADLVFPGQNDLVVDTDSMADIPGLVMQPGDIEDFGTSDIVHHTNYFAQKRTLDFILGCLK